MKWWQIRKRNEDLERELRSDLELEEEERAIAASHRMRPAMPLGVRSATPP